MYVHVHVHARGCCTYSLNVTIICQVWLSTIGYTPVLPGYTLPEGTQVRSGQQSLVVVPVSYDVYGTGEDDHPGNGLVERQVLV